MTKIEQKFIFKLMDNKWYNTDNNEILLLLPVLLEENIKKVKKTLEQFYDDYEFLDSELIEKIKQVTLSNNVVAYNTITRIFLPVKKYERFIYITPANKRTIVLNEKDIEKLRKRKD